MKRAIRPALICFLFAVGIISAVAESSRILYKRGKDAEARQNYEQAYDLYKQAYDQSPKDLSYRSAYERLRFLAGASHVHRGQLLREAGRLQEALAEFQKAGEIDPSSAIAKQEIQVTNRLIQQGEGTPQPSVQPPSVLERRLQDAGAPVELSAIPNVPMTMVNTLDEALRILKNSVRKKENVSVGLVGNCADVIPELAERGVVPDILTDQTSAHDPLNGYVPNGMPLAEALELRKIDPKAYEEKSLDSIARHVEGMLRLQKMGSVTFDYGNNIRTFAFQRGVENAYDFPGFVPAYIRPLFCEGRGPFRWVALSGEPSDIHATDDLVLELFPDNRILRRWIGLARKRIKFQGMPARICWLGYGERAQFGLAMNEMVKKGRLQAPIVM